MIIVVRNMKLTVGYLVKDVLFFTQLSSLNMTITIYDFLSFWLMTNAVVSLARTLNLFELKGKNHHAVSLERLWQTSNQTFPVLTWLRYHLDIIPLSHLSPDDSDLQKTAKGMHWFSLNAASALSQSAGKWHCCSSSEMCGWFLSVDNVAIFVSCPVVLSHFLCQIRSSPNYLCCAMQVIYTSLNIF